jgi:hypothetical protein
MQGSDLSPSFQLDVNAEIPTLNSWPCRQLQTVRAVLLHSSPTISLPLQSSADRHHLQPKQQPGGANQLRRQEE